MLEIALDVVNDGDKSVISFHPRWNAVFDPVEVSCIAGEPYDEVTKKIETAWQNACWLGAENCDAKMTECGKSLGQTAMECANDFCLLMPRTED